MLAINVTWDTVSQLLVIGVINGAAYGVLGVGFATILGVTGRFHFAFGFTYALAAYGVFWASARAGMPYVVAVVFGIVVCIIIGVAMERFAYRTLAKQAGAAALLAVFVASLGIAIAGENIIRLTFSSAAQQIGGGTSLRTPIHLGPTSFLWLDVWQVVSGFVLVVSYNLVLKYTGLGRAIKATRGNPEMARIIGIDPNRIYIVCFAVGSLFAGVAAYWYGAKYSVQADMGFKPVIFAFVIGFLAGTASSPIRIFTVGIIVSIIEQLSSIFLEVRWTQLVVFVILVVYLGALSIEPRKVYAAVRHPRLFASNR